MSQRDQVLKMLREAGRRGVTNSELNHHVGYRYSARVFELRNRGFDIETVNGKGGLCTFYLKAEPPTLVPPSPEPPSVGGGEQLALFDLPSRPLWMDPAA